MSSPHPSLSSPLSFWSAAIESRGSPLISRISQPLHLALPKILYRLQANSLLEKKELDMKKLFLELSFAALCTALLSACSSESGTNSGSQERKNFSDSGSNDDGKSSDSEGNSSSLEGDKSDNGSVYNAAENTLTDLRDGQTYRIVKIDSQIWMAENLNYIEARG